LALAPDTFLELALLDEDFCVISDTPNMDIYK
jgi:hypothetical protein